MNSEYESEYESDYALQQKEQAERAEIENQLSTYLLNGEKILWCGKQQPGTPTATPLWVKATLFLLLFAFIYFFFFNFFTFFNRIIPLIAAAVISVILYIKIPKILSNPNSKIKFTTYSYAITNKRLITYSNSGIKSNDLKKIKYVKCFQSDNGRGNVYYSDFSDFNVTKNGTAIVVGKSRKRDNIEVKNLYNIINPKEVCEILQNAVNGYADTSYYSNSEPVHKAPAAEIAASQYIPPRYSYSEYSYEFTEKTEYDENIFWTGYVKNNSNLHIIVACFIGIFSLLPCTLFVILSKSIVVAIIALIILAAVIYGIFKVKNESKFLVAITDRRLLIKKKKDTYTSISFEFINSISHDKNAVFIKVLYKSDVIKYQREIQNSNPNSTVFEPHTDYLFVIENGAEDFYNTLLSLTSSNTKQPY